MKVTKRKTVSAGGIVGHRRRHGYDPRHRRHRRCDRDAMTATTPCPPAAATDDVADALAAARSVQGRGKVNAMASKESRPARVASSLVKQKAAINATVAAKRAKEATGKRAEEEVARKAGEAARPSNRRVEGAALP